VASGEILDGSHQPPGTIGGESTADLLPFQARLTDTTVKAVVLRVDSPGGSNVSRRNKFCARVQALRKERANLVVVSMSNLRRAVGRLLYFPPRPIRFSRVRRTLNRFDLGVFSGGADVPQHTLEKLGVKVDGIGTRRRLARR